MNRLGFPRRMSRPTSHNLPLAPRLEGNAGRFRRISLKGFFVKRHFGGVLKISKLRAVAWEGYTVEPSRGHSK